MRGDMDCVASLAMTGKSAPPRTSVMPAQAGIQYAEAHPFDHQRLWNAGSSGQTGTMTMDSAVSDAIADTRCNGLDLRDT
jgi:hypothetical protein